jgi:hypothetical protein
MSLWGNTDQAADKPKFLTADEKAATAGIDATEATIQANKDKGVAHAGWVTTSTYTDAQGATRNKTEVLVAMGSMQSVADGGSDDDADDTTIGADTDPV